MFSQINQRHKMSNLGISECPVEVSPVFDSILAHWLSHVRLKKEVESGM